MAIAQKPDALDAVEATPRQTFFAIAASCLGWSLDLFDLFILLYVAPTIGALFFPSQFPTLSLAAVYASFAVTLLMRPVGSAVFGSYADRHGRKGAMVVAVVGVGISTAAFGTLPTLQQAGLISPVLFLILRLVQGVFVGGVVASTHTIGTESVSPKWRGTMSGLIGGGGAAVGALLASIVFLVTSSIFPGDSFAAWGWRCMFFAGILSSVLGLAVFNSLEESPLWRLAQAKKALSSDRRSPLATLFSADHRGVLLVNLMITIGGGAGYYLTSGYLPSFLKIVNKLPGTTTSLILMGASVGALIASLVVGWISDQVGRKPTFIVIGLVNLILIPVCYRAMAGVTDVAVVTGCAIALAFLGNAGYAPVLIFLNERFPTSLRATGTGLSWNIGFAIGGMMPTFVSLASPTPTDLPLSLSIFAGGVFLLYLIGSFIVPETRDRMR
ncbi:hypothetical protein GCM10011611_02970 [Aliidongia dinghuensis]|uniref:Major facilitator superfamily (MFS) profile domain-containing protein n=1 Tax=Aliidongia dinghuensis TaxID=1867774 RepID=A0A8J2YPJ3_9PROT|nr:MFS transporter [Aliidongia dinghuensis]GGF00803.1 hypothetical protein GCM10011611_02970 [Aliidongia dinghuensis]